MKESPILFSGPMVAAINDGRKTQTRRVIKPQPTCECGVCPEEMSATTPEGWQTMGHSGQWWCPCCTGDWRPRCPYGRVGDLLWVRETWWHGPQPNRVEYDADMDENAREAAKTYGAQKRPSIYLPKRFARLWLEITDVRVQRLQEISEADAIAEGCPHCGRGTLNNAGAEVLEFCIEWFYRLWNSINAARGYGWDKNPLVWALTFKRVERVGD